MSVQRIRIARIDTTRLPPNVFLVADGCPKLLEGHAFYACQVHGRAEPDQDKPSIAVICEFLRGTAPLGDGARDVWCAYGGTPNTNSGVRFGIPTVALAEDVHDGSTPD